MNVIIYGIGSGRIRVEKYLKKCHKIIGYSDSFFGGNNFNDKKFYKPNNLLNVEFDYIIIAIGDGDISKKVFQDLINYKIEKTKILDFYENYCYIFRNEFKITNRIMKNTDKSFDGLILGISHGKVGINPKYLSKSFYNFAWGSQDLFYNLKQLNELQKNYKERIKNLQYVILDMFSYTYFNYDVSLTKNALKYFRDVGLDFDELHNFPKDIIESLKTSRKNQEILFNDLFNSNIINVKDDMKEVGSYDDMYSDFSSKKARNKILSDEEIKTYKRSQIVYSSIQKKEFSDTEKENIKVFEEILKTLKEINHNIKIYIVLIPQYKVVEDNLKIMEQEWKIKFYNTLNNFKKNYNFKVLDFKNNEEISSEKKYYYDMYHLNYEGAKRFTKLLDSYILYV